jgi:8-oxo-dGTP diphosphatase
VKGGKDQECRAEIASILPLDEMEQQHIADALAWVDSGAPLYRTARPATPPKHLVAYFAVVDADHVLLVDHKNAQLWLPTGGHVEPNEHPRATVERELLEELGLRLDAPVAAPIMITCTETVGATAGHTDVSLWYVVHGARHADVVFDAEEFHRVQWFAFSDVPLQRTDPHMGRFLRKLSTNDR